VQVRDVAFRQRDDVDAGEGEALEETRGVFEETTGVFEEVSGVFEEVPGVFEEVFRVFEEVPGVFEQTTGVFVELLRSDVIVREVALPSSRA